MIIEFFVWLLPIVAFFTIAWLHLFKIMYNDGSVRISAIWSFALSFLATCLAGLLYFILVTLFIFGYSQESKFDLQPLPHTDGKAYVGIGVDNGITNNIWFKSGNQLVSLGVSNVSVTEDIGTPKAVCTRYATHFPKLLNGGPFDDISFASRCTITVPTGTIAQDYSPTKPKTGSD